MFLGLKSTQQKLKPQGPIAIANVVREYCKDYVN